MANTLPMEGDQPAKLQSNLQKEIGTPNLVRSAKANFARQLFPTFSPEFGPNPSRGFFFGASASANTPQIETQLPT
jgi:hypothetical protein